MKQTSGAELLMNNDGLPELRRIAGLNGQFRILARRKLIESQVDTIANGKDWL